MPMPIPPIALSKANQPVSDPIANPVAPPIYILIFISVSFAAYVKHTAFVTQVEAWLQQAQDMRTFAEIRGLQGRSGVVTSRVQCRLNEEMQDHLFLNWSYRRRERNTRCARAHKLHPLRRFHDPNHITVRDPPLSSQAL